VSKEDFFSWTVALLLFLLLSLCSREFAELLEKYGSNGSTGSTRNSPIQQSMYILSSLHEMHIIEILYTFIFVHGFRISLFI